MARATGGLMGLRWVCWPASGTLRRETTLTSYCGSIPTPSCSADFADRICKSFPAPSRMRHSWYVPKVSKRRGADKAGIHGRTADSALPAFAISRSTDAGNLGADVSAYGVSAQVSDTCSRAARISKRRIRARRRPRSFGGAITRRVIAPSA